MKELLLAKIRNKNITVGVVGLGYVGLPLAVEKAKAGYKNHCRRNSVCVGGHLCQGR